MTDTTNAELAQQSQSETTAQKDTNVSEQAFSSPSEEVATTETQNTSDVQQSEGTDPSTLPQENKLNGVEFGGQSTPQTPVNAETGVPVTVDNGQEKEEEVATAPSEHPTYKNAETGQPVPSDTPVATTTEENPA